MALTKTTVTGRLPLPTDLVLPYGTVWFALRKLDVDKASNDVLMPVPVTAAIAANGTFSIDLWPNERGERGTVYDVSAHLKVGASRSDTVVSMGIIIVPEVGPVDIAALMQIPTDAPTAPDVLAQVLAAAAVAEGVQASAAQVRQDRLASEAAATAAGNALPAKYIRATKALLEDVQGASANDIGFVTAPEASGGGYYSYSGTAWTYIGQGALAGKANKTEVQAEIAKIAPYQADVDDTALAFTDAEGKRLWIGANNTDGGPDSWAQHMLKKSFGVADQAQDETDVNGEPIFFAVRDSAGNPTSLAIRATDGDFSEFVVARMGRRLTEGGYVTGGGSGTGAMSLRQNMISPRLQWSMAKGLARKMAGEAPQTGVITTTLNGEPVRLQLPAGYDDGKPVVVVLACEGTDYANKANGLLPRGDFSNVPNGAGVAWLSGRMHSNSWGNAACMADVRAMYEWATSVISVSGFIVFGNSMGGVAALNVIQRDVVPGVYGCYLTDPAIDLRERYLNNPDGNVGIAYGLSADGLDEGYATKTAGFDPMIAEWARYRGMPINIRASSTDTTVPLIEHGRPFETKLKLHNDIVVTDLGSGNHNNANRFVASDFIAFINKCCGGPLLY